MIDINTLDASQLAAIQKQLKELSKAKKQSRSARNEVITAMLRAKDDAGAFQYSTREIALALAEQGIGLDLELFQSDEPDAKAEIEQEIRRIQAKKQHLEKLTDKQGQLVYPEGTFGYKPSQNFSQGTGMAAGKVRVETILGFFKTRADELTAEQVAEIKAALKGGAK